MSYYAVVQNMDDGLFVCNSGKLYTSYDDVIKDFQTGVQHWYESAAKEYLLKSKMYTWMKHPPMIMHMNDAKIIFDDSDVEAKILKVCEVKKAFTEQESMRLAQVETEKKNAGEAYSKQIRDILF